MIARRALISLGLAAAATGCARAGMPPPVPSPTSATISLDSAAVDAIARILGFEDLRVYDDTLFRVLGEDEAVEVRRRVVLAAGRIGDSAAVPLLLERLHADPSPAVRADAAFALGILGDTADAVIRGLLDAAPSGWIPVRDAETAVSEEVLAALGRLNTDQARLAVTDALREVYPARNPRLTRVAGAGLLAIWRFPGSAGARLVIQRYLDSPNPELRWRAAYALSRGGEPEALPLLLPHAGDTEEHRVRAYVARALDATRADSAGVRDTAIATLVAATGDPHPHVRINALRALATFGAHAPLDSIVARLVDPVRNVGMAAIAALAAIGADGGVVTRPLQTLLADPELPLPLRGAALAALASLDSGSALPTLQAWTEGRAEQRYLAARALTAMDPDVVRSLRTALSADPDRRVALAALGAGDPTAADSVARRRLVRAALPPVPPPTSAVFYRDIARRYVAATLAGEPRPRARINTPHGPVVIELLPDQAPLTVYNFVRLARSGFFDLGVWHRVVPNFVLQDGAPGGDPDGGPGWAIRDELNRVRYDRGVLGMALSGPDTGGSQWFVTHSPQPHLDGGYTVFGRVIEGIEAADAVLQGEFIASISVEW